MSDKTPMTKDAASRIQSTQVRPPSASDIDKMIKKGINTR
jgi:hypothetical protein